MKGNMTSVILVTSLMVGAVSLTAWLGCAGKGVDYLAIEEAVANSCSQCHDFEARDELHEAIMALDNSFFTEANFPDSNFPDGLLAKTVESMIDEADPVRDGQMDPAWPVRKAWIMHEMNELYALMDEDIPPDYTNQEGFDAFLLLLEGEQPEGCEMGDKLDLGFNGDPEGMQPQWAKKLFELLNEDYDELTDEDRQKIRDYVDSLLPGGLKACVAGEGSAS